MGAVSSPVYIAFQRGSTTIGNGSISAFIAVPEESFSLEVYTEIYAQVEGAKELTAFTSAYDDRIGEVMDNVEAIRTGREDARYDEVVEEANEALDDARQEVADAEKELADGKSEAEQELADARKKLEDAQAEINSGKKELEDSRAQMESSRQELTDRQAELDQASEELNAGIDTLNENIDALNQAKVQYNALAASGKTDDVTIAAMNALYAQIQQGEASIADAQAQIEASRAQIESGQAQINAGWEQIESARAGSRKQKRNLPLPSRNSRTDGQSIMTVNARLRRRSQTANRRLRTRSRNLQMRRKKLRILTVRNGMSMNGVI